MNWLFRLLLRRHFNWHVNAWHNPVNCVFCKVDPPYQQLCLSDKIVVSAPDLKN